MKQAWRWFGPDDLVLLPHVKQAGATGIVSALHHMNRGQAWTDDEVHKRKGQIEAQGLTWDVVESIAVPENIKTRTGNFRELIDNYKASIRSIGRAGIKIACYNFMAITDWTRTDLFWPLPNGGSALRFDMVDFCAYDVLILKRRNAEADHPADRIVEARKRLAVWSESKIAELERNLIDWVPAREAVYDRAGFVKQLDAYKDISLEGLRQNLFEFVGEIVPVAEESGVQLAIHPDDPPFPLFGLPRVNSTADDTRKLLKAIDVRANGVTLCTGSYGANPGNNLVAMAKEFAPRIHFAHLRNTTHEPDGSFYEAEHLDGDTDMVSVAAALLDEETRRSKEGRSDSQIPMRPDHGHLIVDDIGKKVNPGYSCIGRLKGLAELRGVMRTVAQFRAGNVRS
jgi:mannonate dehydratase